MNGSPLDKLPLARLSRRAASAIPAAVRRIALALAVIALAFPTTAAPLKTILLVFDEDPDLPGLAVIDQSVRDTFRAGLPDGVEFCSESLNLSQFKDPGYDGIVRDHLRRKYAAKRPDLIVAVMQPSLEFLLRDGRSLFPGVPIVFCGVDSSYLEMHTMPPGVTGIAIERDYAPTLSIALRLQPDMRDVFVIGGTSNFDRGIEAIARRQLSAFDRRVAVHYVTALPMADLLALVAKLPEHSAIFYLTIFSDGAGRAFVPHAALSRITRVANAPVFVAVDQYLDLGVVGGHVYSVGEHGRQAAEMGLRVLRGETPPVLEQAAYRDVFDGRQLRRWKLDEGRLPRGSEIRHRSRSKWERYGAYIVAGVTVFLLEGALIVALLVNRAQRRRADAASRAAEERRRAAQEEADREHAELTHALRLATLGELTASFAHELGQPLTAILANAQAIYRLARSRRLTPGELEETLGDIAQDATGAAETIHRYRALFRKEEATRSLVDMNAIVEDVVRLLRSDFQRKEIEVSFRRSADLPSIVGDPVELRQVMLNLLVNAGDAITVEPQPRREIRIETARRDGTVSVVVRDTGAGAKGMDLERMFAHFVTTKPNGLGMGLSISRSIVEGCNGRIWATANDDQGLTLHVEIPAA